MPYKSAKQRRYLHAKEPELAAEWDKRYSGRVKGKKKKRKRRKAPNASESSY